MTHLPAKSPTSFQLSPNHDARFGLPVDDDQMYEPFADWLDARLSELVDKWLPLAAPNASPRERAIRHRR